MTGVLLALALVSALAFPWPLTAAIAVAASFYEPLIAFAAGVAADAMYYSVHAARLPYLTVGGALVSVAVVFVRSRLKTSRM